MINLYLDLDPSVKRRPRFRRHGNKVFTHSDPKDLAFKKDVQRLAKPQVDYPLDGPLRCEIVFFIKRPKTVKDKYPTSKRTGDCDNLAKAVLDSLNGLAYNDDSQIISLTASKYYRDVSGIELRLYSLN
jgi:Holliday junction resolvase RusA-like endonuclease